MTQKRKHTKPKKNIRNPERPNGKAWKKGLSPEKRNAGQVAKNA